MEGKNIEQELYPDDESKREMALRYLSNDFPNEFLNLGLPTSEVGSWKFVFPVKTVEELYSQRQRYGPHILPILLKVASEEVRKANEFVHRINEVIKQRNAEAARKISQEALEFSNSLREKWAEMQKEKGNG